MASANELQSHETRLEAARVAFGQFFQTWLKSADCSTKTLMKWSKQAGVPQLSDNTVSLISRGLQPKTSPAFFVSLGELNQLLAAQNYGLISCPTVRKRIEALQPICSADGQPWRASDFFACFVGEINPPIPFKP